MKILINTPVLSSLGGVTNHYLGLKNFWSEDVKYNTVGKRGERSGNGKYWLPWDVFKFISKLLIFKPDIVLLNPSLGHLALTRDFIFMKIALVLGFKVSLFIHGFNWDYAHSLNQKKVARMLNKTSVIFVLAEAFANELRSWGVIAPICLTTTKVDDNLLSGYDPLNRTGKVNNILFLSRVEKEKGVYIVIDSFCILKEKYPHLHLVIAGDGNELPNVRKYIQENNVCDVEILGRISGKKLIEVYKNADLFSFPSYGEGMPTVVLEAMAFGLPVFTRKVGGLVDFFENGKMGYITDSLSAQDFANAMIPYIENRELSQKVALYNVQYAKEHFMASKVAKQLEDILKEIFVL